MPFYSIFSTPLVFWLISVSFVLFQFFLQLSSGVVISAIMSDMALSASKAGLLSSAYYYVYTSFQIPVGMLFDRKNTRVLLTFNVFICSLGCLLFARSHGFADLMCTRLLIGAGSAFAFIGLSHILRQYFNPKTFGFMIGLSETLAFLVTVIFMIIMGIFVTEIKWRALMLYSGVMGLIITALCGLLLPNSSPPSPEKSSSVWKECALICLSPIAWINGLFIGLGFTLITVFGALWAIPFIQLKTGCSLPIASLIDAMLFLGTGLSCPLFGTIESHTPHRRTLLFISYMLTAGLFLLVLFLPTRQPWLIACLLGLMGLSSGAYMLGYTIANEIASAQSQSTSTGFANTLAMLSAPLLQPAVGYFLDIHHQGTYTLANYQHALLIVPLCILLGAILVVFLPQKKLISYY